MGQKSSRKFGGANVGESFYLCEKVRTMVMSLRIYDRSKKRRGDDERMPCLCMCVFSRGCARRNTALKFSSNYFVCNYFLVTFASYGNKRKVNRTFQDNTFGFYI